MPVPKRRKSRSNVHARRSQWKTEPINLIKFVDAGRTEYYLPHRAKIVSDSTGNELFKEYKGRRVTDG
jgi:large subunit ribosomal protein L32